MLWASVSSVNCAKLRPQRTGGGGGGRQRPRYGYGGRGRGGGRGVKRETTTPTDDADRLAADMAAMGLPLSEPLSERASGTSEADGDSNDSDIIIQVP